jgi:CheY-like chemotaxis protein
VSAPTRIALVVENEPLIAMLVCDLLSDMGYVLFEARTCTEAVALLETIEGISLLLTDVDLADGSTGADLAVIANNQFPAVSIVVTSGRGRPEKLPDHVPFIPKSYSRVCLTKTLMLTSTYEMTISPVI